MAANTTLAKVVWSPTSKSDPETARATPATRSFGSKPDQGNGAPAPVPSDATVPDLVEWNYGDCEGLRTEDIRAKNHGWKMVRNGLPG